MKNLFVLLFMICCIGVYGNTYYSQGSLNATSTSSWNSLRGGGGSNPPNFKSGDIFVIQNSHSMTTTGTWTVSGTNSAIQIESGGTLTATFKVSAPAFQVNNGGTYNHNWSNGSGDGNTSDFPGSSSSITLGSSSNVNINGWASSGSRNPSPLPFVDYGNLTINIASLNGDLNCNIAANSTLTINGNLILNATGGNDFCISNNTGTTLTIGGNFEIHNGASFKFTNSNNSSQTYNLNLGGNFDLQSGGNMDLRNGTLYFNYRYGAASVTSNISGTLATNAVTKINWTVYDSKSVTFLSNHKVGSGRSFAVNSNGTLACSTFFLTDAGSFSLLSGGTLKMGDPNGISSTASTGNIQVTGTRSFSTNANYEYNGTSAQVTGNSLPSSVYGITFGNNAGVTLTGNLTATNYINMTSGNVTTGTYTLMLSNAAPNALSRTAGYVIGTMTRSVTNNTGSYLFPLGLSSLGRMVTVNFTTAPTVSGTLTAKYITGDAGNFLTPLNDNGYLVDVYSNTGYWQIDQNTNLGGVYTLSINAESIQGVNDCTLLRIIKRASSPPNSPWTLVGNHITGTGTNSNPVANRSGMSGFSQFVIAGNSSDNPLNGVLPVEMLSFSSAVSGRNVKLYWATSSEINNKGFEIQRSGHGDNSFSYLGFINGKGNSNSVTNYTYEDIKMSTGKYDYRIKQVDLNGNSTYFNLNNLVEVGLPGKFSLSQNYPNPFNPSTRIDFELPADSRVSLTLYDALGREVKNLLSGELKSAGFYTIEFNASGLPSGVYYYRMTAGDNGNEYTFSKKLAVIK
ncbi:MAG: T9SS type A sorting domain-containing protein [Bacteroidetes bacterium]|nr:T9SS type A sorting domain-containing protein [Bacteroidota bacterium]